MSLRAGGGEQSLGPATGVTSSLRNDVTAMSSLLRRPGSPGRDQGTVTVVPPLSRRPALARAVLLVVCAFAVSLVLELVVVSSLKQHAAQRRAFQQFRADLAGGTAPLGSLDAARHPLRPGSPVAYLEIPSLGLHQVVGEGTTAGSLFTGPGHRRDTPLPGQAGVSVVLGRRASFGGPFARLGQLRKGALIRATTGSGVYEYRVIGVRHEGDPVPAPPGTGAGRLLLATAAGTRFMPSGVLRVDADLAIPAVSGPGGRVNSASLPPAEQMMAGDPGSLGALVLWLQALVVVTFGATWAWHQWGRAKAWIVCLPPLLLVGLSASAEAAHLLPNLL